MAKIELTLFADYHQFYIQDDDDRFGDLSEAWTEEATNKLLAVSDRVTCSRFHVHQDKVR